MIVTYRVLQFSQKYIFQYKISLGTYLSFKVKRLDLKLSIFLDNKISLYINTFGRKTLQSVPITTDHSF